MTKEQMIKSLQEIDKAEKLLMRSLDDWEEDYISNNGYDSFVKGKLGMDCDDIETLIKIRKAVSNYCTKAIDSSTAKLRLGANFMENDIDEASYEDRNRNDLVLECVDKITSQRAIDTLQTIVNCLHEGIDHIDSEYTGNGWKESNLKNDFVLNESQFNDMVNVEKAVDDCKEESTEENTSDSLFPESFKPWLKYITIDNAVQIINSCEEENPDMDNEKIMEKAMERIKELVVDKLAADIMLFNSGIIEDKEVLNAVLKYIEKHYKCSFNVTGSEIKISYAE